MEVSVLRVTACAGVLVGGLLLGNSATGVALADQGGWGHGRRDDQSSKGVNTDRATRGHGHFRTVGERWKRHHDEAPESPPTTFGREEVSATDSGAATLSEPTGTQAPEPDLVPDIERDADPDATGMGTDGTDSSTEPDVSPDPGPPAEAGGDGSDHVDNTVVSAAETEPEPVAVKTPETVVEYPFPFYLLEIRRDGGDWWNANQIIARFHDVIGNYLMPPAPEPEPAPMPAPAFRGGAPEPEPVPVLDVSGGIGGGGSDYQAGDFGGAPVLRAPVIAVPVLPAASARFPAARPAEPPGAGAGLARAASTEPGAPASSGVRYDGAQSQPASGTVTSMSGQAPRQGYTDYLRRPGMPQLVGAALPGVAGILMMTYGGGVIGYRQARAGRMVRTTGAARFLP